MESKILTDHTLIIDELERSIKFHNWNSILTFLPKGSFLVGGYFNYIDMNEWFFCFKIRYIANMINIMISDTSINPLTVDANAHN